MKNKFKDLDRSGDKKYFTIIPNYIVNNSTVYEQAIYLYMKRVAGESGSCWTSAQEIAKKLGCSRNTVSKYRNELVERGWIKIIGKAGKTKPTNEYAIVDLWKLNYESYSPKESSTGEQSPKESSTGEKKVQLVHLESSTGVHKEELIKKNHKKKKPLIYKDTYGEFQRVRLTSDEHKKLSERLGSITTLSFVAELDGYIESLGKDKYKSHYATILNWSRRRAKGSQKSFTVIGRKTVA